MRPFAMFRLGRRSNVTGIVDLFNETLDDTVVTPTTATCDISYNSNGSVTSNSFLNSATWNNISAGSSYDIRVTPTAGTMSTGTTGSWLNLGSNRAWTVQRASIGSKACTATVEIRDAGTLTVLDSCTITLTATVEAS